MKQRPLAVKTTPMDRLSCFLLFAMPLMALAGFRGRPSPSAAVQAAQQQLEAAGDKDAAAHDKAGCFCQTNLADKQQTVENMQQQLTGLSSDIDASTAKIAQLDVEVKQHQQELESSSSALASAEAIRKKDSEKFADDEQTHTQSIDQLNQALAAIRNPHGASAAMAQMLSGQGASAALIAIREVTKRTQNKNSQSRHGRLMFLQAQQALKSASSQAPGVVTGVMERMLTSFNTNLQGMRDDEIEAKNRHEGLVSAKSGEISAQRKFVVSKNQRLAKTKVAVNFKKSNQERSQKVLDSNIQLLNTLKQICQRNDDSFETRKSNLQAEITALAEAQTELAGAQLLSVAVTAKDDGADLICSVAPEFREKEWREQASGACSKAKAGKKQDAADDVEALESSIKEAQNAASNKQESCSEEVRGAQVAASVAASQESADANFVGSAQKDAEEQIDALTSQADGAAKAKEAYAQVAASQKEAFQALRVATARGKEVLTNAANRESGKPAAMKINEAIADSEKLMAAVSDFDSANDPDAQQLAGELDEVQRMAGKALIPLRLMKADSEESAIAIKEEGASRAHARTPQCDAGALAAEVARLKGYRAKLGRAAEGLAWDSLR